MPLATWGPVTFEVSADRVRTWHEARRSGAARWYTHDVHLAKPKREFLGPGLDALSLQVRLDRALGLVPKDELKTLRDQRDKGVVNELLIGEESQGQFSLVDLSEGWKRTAANGDLLIVDVELKLEEYN